MTHWQKSVPELEKKTTVKENDILGNIELIVPAIKLISKIIKEKVNSLVLIIIIPVGPVLEMSLRAGPGGPGGSKPQC